MKEPKRKPKTNRPDTTMIALWVPVDLAKQLDAAAKARDLDRSKLIRRAIRETLSRTA